MAKKAKAVKAKKGGFNFSVSDVLASINKRTLETNREKIEERVEVMVTSLAKRESETSRYARRVDRMLADLAAVKNSADLTRWFDKGY